MAKRVAISTLNARSIDILNTIRQNASYQYQQTVPEISKEIDIPRVGEALYGYPTMANEFLNALVNRIALVRVKSAFFNNAYANLKKGYLEFGETVEEVFVNICKAREFSAEKAEQRELKRSIPDVRAAFHTMNWRVQYPITIQDEDLRMAFRSADGVTDLIARIVGSVYTANEYDEYLLFKYLIIKGVTHGKMYPVYLGANPTLKEAAAKFRGASNMLTFMSTKYNATGVHTTTPREDQYFFMDSDYNAQFDVEVLASAFNMNKADLLGHLTLIDDFTSFDNDRFSEIVENTDMIETVTGDELALMANVKGVLVDAEWFQVYDNNLKFSEKYVASGMYWNYFLNSWKTVSYSPFSNAIVFVSDSAEGHTLDDDYTFEVVNKSTSDSGTVLTLAPQVDEEDYEFNLQFVQGADATKNGVAVHKYGSLMFQPNGASVYLHATINGEDYTACTRTGTSAPYTYTQAKVGTSLNVGGVVLFCKTSLISNPQ